jgi:Ca-activated chloride channel homolog
MKVLLRFPLLTLLLAAAASSALAVPDAPVSKKAALAAMPAEERKWVTDYVAPIITPEEEKLFLELTEAQQRERFKQRFWARRERVGLPRPLGPGYERLYGELRDLAASQYDGIGSDAGRMVVRWGEPDSRRELTECGEVFREAEIWTYRNSSGSSRSEVRHLFYRPTLGAARKLWTPVTQPSEILQPATCIASLDELCLNGAPLPMLSTDPTCQAKTAGGAPLASRKECEGGCAVGQVAQEIRTRPAEGNMILRPPSVPLEDLADLRGQFAGVATKGAAPIALEGPSSSAPASSEQGQVVSAALKQSAPAPAPAGPAVQNPPAAAPLSKKAALAAMPEEERKWLTEFVAPIILPEEEKFFLTLTEPHQREIFKREFWERREVQGLPEPLGPGYRNRYEELRNLVDTTYDGWRSDAGRMVLRYGEPAEIKKMESCSREFRDLEIWTINRPMRGTAKYIFYRPTFNAPRKMWVIGTNESDVFSPGSCRKKFSDLALDCTPVRGDPCNGPVCQDACDVFRAWSEITARQGSQMGGENERAQLLQPQAISTEGLDRTKERFAGIATPGAKAIGVEGPGDKAVDKPGDTARAKPAAAASNTPAAAHRKLSNKEIKELSAKLDPKYKEFLALVELIITPTEREVFLEISDSYQKDKFIDSFWRRRSIDSSGIRTDYQHVYTDRVNTAREQFKNLNNDRSKIFVLNGPPDGVIPIDCQDIYVPLQIWFYERLETLKSKVYLIFYQPMGMGDYKLWTPLDGVYVLQAGGVGGLSGSIASRQVDVTRCAEYRTINQAIAYSTAALGSGPMSMAGVARLFQPPVVETEGVDQVLSMTTELAANAVPLTVAKLVRFPEQRSNKIGVDLSLLVPKKDLKPRTLGEERFFNVDVIGEVVKGDRLIDNFKYRFDVPEGEVSADRIPLTVRRYLYPGEYKLILKVSDGNQSAEGRISEMLKVPEQPDPPTPEELAARAQGRAVIDKTKETGLVPSAISLLPIAKEIATGLQRFETKVADGIRAVDFYLNGSKVMTKTRAPFQADLNLGPLPRKQVIRVVAYGETGRTVGEDEYIVNEGRDIFKVRILSPEKGAKATGPTRVVAAVVTPEGKNLQKLEFFSNESRVATLYQAPFEQTVNIKDSKSLGYVRIIGTLDDGTVAEDLRYVNAPAYISEVSVDAVELYTSVTEKGRPVPGLQASNFRIFEDGAIQKVESFEFVRNLPISLGVMIDTSASMLESLPEAEQAAISFLDYSIGPKDRAFTISFDNEPYILSKLTNRKDKLYRSMAGLRAEGSTALYDAIVFGLYQFTGVKGKKALIILTDGKDTTSKFDFDTALEYVRKSGISVYGIGLKISGAELDVKYKLNKLANVSGGQTFYIDSAKHLDAVYKQINEELRSQYLLTYYSTNATGKEQWRKVEVKVEPSALQARTITGYYP